VNEQAEMEKERQRKEEEERRLREEEEMRKQCVALRALHFLSHQLYSLLCRYYSFTARVELAGSTNPSSRYSLDCLLAHTWAFSDFFVLTELLTLPV